MEEAILALCQKPPPANAICKVWNHQRIDGKMSGHNGIDKVEHVGRARLGVQFPCICVAKNIAAHYDCNELPLAPRGLPLPP